MKDEKKAEKKQPRFLALTGIAFQMGITIYLFSYLGKYLDRLNESSYLTMIFTLIGLVLSFYNLIRQVNRLNNKEDNV